MNKNLYLAILAISLIPAFFAFGRGITGLAINDPTPIAQAVAQPALQQSHPFLSGVVLIYVLITIVVLAIATSYLITLYGRKPTNTSPHKHLSKSLGNIHTAFKSPFKGIQFTKKLTFANISDEKASQYIVGIVAIVGFIAILIMIL
jgi:uncharacterized BrkB/YihY/UPF0761 family membrane protein